MPTAERDELAERLRQALAGEPTVREVAMFGGRSFMVNEKLVACAMRDGDLLVRLSPERAAELVARPGAAPAEMGAGRRMGKGWVSVSAGVIEADTDLAGWVEAALAFNRDATRARRG